MSIIPRAWSISQAKDEDFENKVSAVVCLQRSKALCCDVLILLISTYGYMRWLVKTVSTCYSEIGFRCIEQAQVRICALAG